MKHYDKHLFLLGGVCVLLILACGVFDYLLFKKVSDHIGLTRFFVNYDCSRVIKSPNVVDFQPLVNLHLAANEVPMTVRSRNNWREMM